MRRLEDLSWLDSPYSRRLFSAAGVSKSDFHNIRGIAKAGRDRVVVWALSGLDRRPKRLPANSTIVYTREGYTEYYLPIEPFDD